MAASAVIDQDDISNDLAHFHIASRSATTEGNPDFESIFEFLGESSSQSSSADSQASRVNQLTNSALGFLRASFPLLPIEKLNERINDAKKDGDFDMERLVEALMNEEYSEEWEERGLTGEDELDDEMKKWYAIPKPKNENTLPYTGEGKKKKSKGKTIILNDVRQKHSGSSSVRKPLTTDAYDPWSQLSSISDYLETLLPSRPSSFFLSHFHNPKFGSPSDALRAALQNTKDAEFARHANALRLSQGIDPAHAVAITSLLEVIRASPEVRYDDLDQEARTQLHSDMELALFATDGSPDSALDVVTLLQQLEHDREGVREMGLYHSPVKKVCQSTTFAQMVVSPALTLSPSSGNAVPSSVPRPKPPPAPNRDGWHEVRVRPKLREIHPLAEYIPAYNLANLPRRRVNMGSNGSSNSKGTGAAQYKNISTAGMRAESYKDRITQLRIKHNEKLRAASRYWSGRNAANRGGEVAMYYAMEAQNLQEQARHLKLEAARDLVNGRRCVYSLIYYFGGVLFMKIRSVAQDSDVLDVHHCTRDEAIDIVQEVLDEGWVSINRPLTIITGRGKHSRGGVSVLGPTLKNLLQEEGWLVSRSEGELTVRSQTSN